MIKNNVHKKQPLSAKGALCTSMNWVKDEKMLPNGIGNTLNDVLKPLKAGFIYLLPTILDFEKSSHNKVQNGVNGTVNA